MTITKTKITQLVRCANSARREWGILKGEKSDFGDCAAVCVFFKRIVEDKADFEVVLVGGSFATNKGKTPHTWTTIEGHIFDPTIDQFGIPEFNESIYFSHPQKDGNKYVHLYTSKKT